MFGASSSIASPADFERPTSAAHEPLWATTHVRVSVVRLFPLLQPLRLASKPGFDTSSVDGGGGGGGGGGGAPATAYDVFDTLKLDTSTASNAEPGIVFSALRSESFQPGSGAPLMKKGEPLSARIIPCFFSARRITWFAAENRLMS